MAHQDSCDGLISVDRCYEYPLVYGGWGPDTELVSFSVQCSCREVDEIVELWEVESILAEFYGPSSE